MFAEIPGECCTTTCQRETLHERFQQWTAASKDRWLALVS